MNIEKELKPCPVCFNKRIMSYVQNYYNLSVIVFKCPVCGHTSIGFDFNETAKFWNDNRNGYLTLAQVRFYLKTYSELFIEDMNTGEIDTKNVISAQDDLIVCGDAKKNECYEYKDYFKTWRVWLYYPSGREIKQMSRRNKLIFRAGGTRE